MASGVFGIMDGLAGMGKINGAGCDCDEMGSLMIMTRWMLSFGIAVARGDALCVCIYLA